MGILREMGLRRVSETRSRMGTVVTLTAVAPDAAEARRWIDAAFEEMTRLEDVLSRHRPDTAVGRLNATGSLGAAPRELLTLLRRSEEISALSDGAFDISVAPLLQLYERASAHGGPLPSRREISETVALVDYRRIRVDGDRVTFDDPRMAITLDGIAKGFIVDRTIDVLVSAGAHRVMVNAGGDMATAGPGSAADPWTVAIQNPHADDVIGFVRLAGDCIATSGDYMRTFTEDRRFHHIIDPRTGRSPEEVSSVSVVAPSAMDADACSTAVLVLGPEAGPAFLERLDGVDGMVVTKTGRRIGSAGFAGHSA